MQTVPPEARVYPGKNEGQLRTSYEELLSMCLRNAANAFNGLALSGEQAGDHGISLGYTETQPSKEKYQLCVIDLDAHILDKHKNDQIKELEDEIWKDWESHTTRFRPYVTLHHAIVELVESKGLLARKVRRELVSA